MCFACTASLRINPYSLEEVTEIPIWQWGRGLGVSRKVNSECASVLMWPLFFSFYLIPLCRSIKRNIWGAYVSNHILQQTWPTTETQATNGLTQQERGQLPVHLTRDVSQWLNSTPKRSSVLRLTPLHFQFNWNNEYWRPAEAYYLVVNSARNMFTLRLHLLYIN